MKMRLTLLAFALGLLQAQQPIQQTNAISVSATLQSAAVANGNGTSLAVSGESTAILTVNCSVACSGGTTINFEGTQDNTNWSALSTVQLGTNTIATTVVNQGTTVTLWETPVAGLVNIRARISAYSAGTITVTAATVPTAYNNKVVNANIVSTVTQNTNNTQIAGTNLVADPCQTATKNYLPISEATTSLTTIITGTSSLHTYVCSIVLIASTAQNINLISATGTNCATTVHGSLLGTNTSSAAAANGVNLAANGGFSLGNGSSAVLRDTNAADNICYSSSGAGQTSGALVYVQQ